MLKLSALVHRATCAGSSTVNSGLYPPLPSVREKVAEVAVWSAKVCVGFNVLVETVGASVQSMTMASSSCSATWKTKSRWSVETWKMYPVVSMAGTLPSLGPQPKERSGHVIEPTFVNSASRGSRPRSKMNVRTSRSSFAGEVGTGVGVAVGRGVEVGAVVAGVRVAT